MTPARALRERIREELTQEIVEIARAQLAAAGAENLSLRAIARDLGMAPSAVYRYFPSRDDLLTRLVIDAYDAVGEQVERAEATVARDDYMGRWLAAARALRGWAVTHPHEYALIYGSPVRGYQAPESTVRAAMRDKIVYGRVISDAHRAGVLAVARPASPVTATLALDVERVRAAVLPDVPDMAVINAVVAWSGLFGLISLELFGHFNNIIEDASALFDQSVLSLGELAGLPRPTPSPEET
ncbi:MAG TPA: TetR/AcrR family transcriptional regulator [Micromonosporaceae bacterium]